MPDSPDEKVEQAVREAVGAGVAAAAAGPPQAAPLAITAPPEDAGSETQRPAGASNLSADKIEETYGISDAEYAVLLRTVCKDAPREIAAFFMLYCKRQRLDPFGRQVYLWPDKTQDVNGVRKPVPGCTWSIVTSIAGMRSIASRNELYRGQSRPKWTFETDEAGFILEFEKEDSQYGHIAGKRRVEECEISVFRAIPQAPDRKDLYMEFVGIVRFDEYVKRGYGKIQGNWEHQPENQSAVRAEAQALRKGFPEDVGSLYLEEEMSDRQTETERPRGVSVDTMNGEERTVVDDEIEACAKELGLTAADLYLQRKNWGSKIDFLAYLNGEVEKKNATRRNKRDVGDAEEAIEAEHKPVEEPAAPPESAKTIMVQGKKTCALCKAKPGKPHEADCPAPLGDDEESAGKLPL